MPHPFWPFFDLRIRTARVELRIPDDDLVIELAQLAARGVHAEAFMPFAVPWTKSPSPELERRMMQWHWRNRSEWRTAFWRLCFAVLEDGRAVGSQDLAAQDFGVLRSVNTGSWLGHEHQGRGIGKEMRAAVLHLAFAGLDAVEARSGAFVDNAASVGVSRALGYVTDGENLTAREGVAAPHVRFVLRRADWEARRRDDIVVEGLTPCLPLLIGL